MAKQRIRLERLPEVINRYGLSRATIYERIKEGTIPPPIHLGERAIAFVESENTAVISAIIAGKSKDAIKDLVKSLIKERNKT